MIDRFLNLDRKPKKLLSMTVIPIVFGDIGTVTNVLLKKLGQTFREGVAPLPYILV